MCMCERFSTLTILLVVLFSVFFSSSSLFPLQSRSHTVRQTQYQLSICMCVCGCVYLQCKSSSVVDDCMVHTIVNKLREHWASTLCLTSIWLVYAPSSTSFRLPIVLSARFFPGCIAKYHKISKERTLKKLQMMLFASHSSEPQWLDVCLWNRLADGKINIVRSSYFVQNSNHFADRRANHFSHWKKTKLNDARCTRVQCTVCSVHTCVFTINFLRPIHFRQNEQIVIGNK